MDSKGNEKVKAFQPFRFRSRQYLAFPVDRNVMIMDEYGNNFGSWYSIDSFKKHFAKGGAEPVGKIKLSYILV